MLEELLYKHLQDNKDQLQEFLATYGETMAIFNQEAPKDTDPGWGKGSQYGRIVYAVDKNEDPERKVSGVLSVDILCENGQQAPEYVEPVLKDLMDGYFFTDSENTIAARWSASNYFTEPPQKVNGITLTFDLLAFPNQHTTDPDPVQAMNTWLKKRYNSVKVIGAESTELPSIWKPEDTCPALYCRLCRLDKSNRINSTANVDWFDTELRIHVMAPSENVETSYCKDILQALTQKPRVKMEDESPMLIYKTTVNNGADQLRVGQAVINTTYGVLPTIAPKPKLQHAYVEGLNTEKEVQ